MASFVEIADDLLAYQPQVLGGGKASRVWRGLW
jgi:hypothetical protein